MNSLSIIVLLACSAAAAEPRTYRDLAYAEPKDERHLLDVYAPAEGENHPIVFWIHGGGWQQGDKTQVQAKPKAFVDRGCVFVSTNYRFVPNATIKQIAQDVAKAIRWTHDHAKEYGGDPNTLFVMGHSAGAQLAALVCTDQRYLKAEGLSLAIIKGCVPVDGDTYDVPMQISMEPPKSAASHAKKFGSVEDQKALSAVNHVAAGKGIPPFLVLHVASHALTTAQANRLAKALQDAGIAATAYAAENKNHTTINADLGQPDDEPTQALWQFMDGVLKPKR